MMLGVALILFLQAAAADAERRIETVEVRSSMDQANRGAIAGYTELSRAEVEAVAPTHPNELFAAVPGTWVSRGSGQEHLTAIRSPVLTGPGACGAFMLREDRVPLRPTGFCNVNGLFEVNLIQAARVEVLRGPGSVLYGSNALHGVIDVATREPDGAAPGFTAALEAGTDDYYRARLGLNSAAWTLYGNHTDSGSFRDDEGFNQSFVNAVWRTRFRGADVRTQFSAADLDQDTAGFILGEDAYRDPQLRTRNLNPEAFRKASAQRLSSRWSWAPSPASQLELTPYLRHNDMEFLQHFLPGKPLETNSHVSAGALLAWSPNDSLAAGLDLEWAEGELTEFQAKAITDGSAFLRETRPQGLHYDYSTRSLMLAGWAQYLFELSDIHTLTLGIRGEVLDYDYDNRMLDGNTRDDGSVCGFGGCLPQRPADRSDRFSNWTPEIGLSWRPRPRLRLHARLARGYRAPQATELYRLQRGQAVADLDSVELDTAELGLRVTGERLDWDLVAFAMRKDNDIFRDADGFNVSDGRTRHLGLEASFDARLNPRWSLSGHLSWTRHEYDFDRNAAAGEIIRDGNRVDTAPEWLGGLQLNWVISPQVHAALDWQYTGSYFLDAANAHRYGGHSLVDLRLAWSPATASQALVLRITNLLDDRYAERADFAFGNYRYFPGAGRRLFLEWRYAR